MTVPSPAANKSPSPPVEEPQISVIMTVLNVEPTIRLCLDSLLALDYPEDRYEIIIVDALSKDRTQEIIRRYAAGREHPSIRLFEKAGSIGVGRNEAFRHADGELIAITDGDNEVSPGWLREHLKGFDDDIAGSGGPIDNAVHTLFTDTISCLDNHGPATDIVPLVGVNKYLKPFRSRSDIYTCITSNALYRRSVLEQAAGFDERLLATEDAELNQRLLTAGHTLKYDPLATVTEHHRSTVSAFHRQQRNYAFGQAVVNSLHKEMFRLIHWAPQLALMVLLVLAGLWVVLEEPLLLWSLPAMMGLYLLVHTIYGVKCARLKGNWRFIFTIPMAVIVWHTAWVRGYTLGQLRRHRLLAGGLSLSHGDSSK